jgi:hypothetical protein
VDELVAALPQVLITTHSPMVLNYLEDEIAIGSMIKLIDCWITKKISYSLIDLKFYTIIPKQ